MPTSWKEERKRKKREETEELKTPRWLYFLVHLWCQNGGNPQHPDAHPDEHPDVPDEHGQRTATSTERWAGSLGTSALILEMKPLVELRSSGAGTWGPSNEDIP